MKKALLKNLNGKTKAVEPFMQPLFWIHHFAKIRELKKVDKTRKEIIKSMKKVGVTLQIAW